MEDRNILALYAVILALGIVLSIIYLLTYVVPILPVKLHNIITAIAIVLGMLIALRVFLAVFNRGIVIPDPHLRSTINFVIEIVWYAITGLAVAASFGVDVSSVILGSAFASVILGLAAQTVLSNVIAGLAILLARPFKIGDRITLASWQFGVVFPTYPPKFFSQDFLINGFTGTVKEIRMMYTVCYDDEGATVVIPNSILVNSLVRHYGDTIITTVRFQVQNMDVDDAVRRAEAALKECEMVISSRVLVDEAYSNGFVLKIIATCRGNRQDLCRSEMLRKLLRELGASNR